MNKINLQELVSDLDWDEETEAENPLCDLYSGRETALSLLRVEAQEVAAFSDDIDHSPGLSWHIDFSLHVVRIPALPHAFALLKLDWDDNWGRWEWSCEVAIEGAISHDEATSTLLEIYRASYIGDASGSFRGFLDNLV